MQYFVVGQDGTKHGPADIETLNQWVVQNRIEPGTMLENVATMDLVTASAVDGIVFLSQPGNGTFEPHSNYPRGPLPRAMDKGEGDLKIAWTFAIMGLVSGFFLGMCFVLFSLFNIFSILGIVCCFAAKKKGNEDTKAAMICSVVGIVLGPVIGYGTMAFFFRFMD